MCDTWTPFGGYDGEDSGPELATLISTVDSKHGDKQPLGESLAQHGALVEGALLRISQAIRKRWNCRRMALVLRLGAASTGDVSLIVACSANKWRDAAGAAEHAAIEIKDKLIASIAPQCLSKQPMAAAALKAVAAAAGVGETGEEKPPKNDGDADAGRTASRAEGRTRKRRTRRTTTRKGRGTTTEPRRRWMPSRTRDGRRRAAFTRLRLRSSRRTRSPRDSTPRTSARTRDDDEVPRVEASLVGNGRRAGSRTAEQILHADLCNTS